jgi:hypothetical protein
MTGTVSFSAIFLLARILEHSKMPETQKRCTYRVTEYVIETSFGVLALLATDQQVDVAKVRT